MKPYYTLLSTLKGDNGGVDDGQDITLYTGTYNRTSRKYLKIFSLIVLLSSFIKIFLITTVIRYHQHSSQLEDPEQSAEIYCKRFYISIYLIRDLIDILSTGSTGCSQSRSCF